LTAFLKKKQFEFIAIIAVVTVLAQLAELFLPDGQNAVCVSGVSRPPTYWDPKTPIFDDFATY